MTLPGEKAQQTAETSSVPGKQMQPGASALPARFTIAAPRQFSRT
jgi:hypothetical protein